ncbi:MAG: hypothetical protein CVU56_27485 [Deltaproteobacteria bacterium HGW-Deltaproteobacteria-14]|nr:MAG: hypothetical protein CVU56_27485 [Deltaproteobacteria bacterium HGW-Deltaproteobacteria-14]
MAVVLTVATAALGACGESKPEPVNDLLGQATAALNFNPTKIRSIDYTITFTYLESDPPDTYSVQEYTSVVHNGQLITILPCRTGSDGTGYNQADVDAVVHFFDEEIGDVNVHASAIFECVRNADTRVNILLNIAEQLDTGFGDLVIAPAGTLCSKKTDWKPDTYLGVCADSQCGDATAVFVFASDCQTISGGDPVYWFCGSPTDWDVRSNTYGTSAISYFPVPDTDGHWEFGVIALDPMRMAQEDPTLTDPEGYLRVWVGIASTHAELDHENGHLVQGTGQATATLLDFAAILDVPPQQPGQPSPQVLVYGNNTDEGVNVSFRTMFGPCDQPVQGTALYDNFQVADVRLDGTSKVQLLLTDPSFTFVRSVAVCEAGWDAANRPTVTCGPPGPLF